MVRPVLGGLGWYRKPSAEHRNCARHVCKNWRKRYKGRVLKFIFFNAAMCITKENFLDVMDELKGLSKKAWKKLIDSNLKWFAKVFLINSQNAMSLITICSRSSIVAYFKQGKIH